MTFLTDKLMEKMAWRWTSCHVCILVLAMFFISCDGVLFPGNQGFPRKVFFDSDGGTKVVRGFSSMHSLEIRTWGGNTDGCECEYDTLGNYISARKDWLAIKHNCRTGEVTITVEPNPSGKSRRLVIGGMVMDSGVDIDVYQGKSDVPQ